MPNTATQAISALMNGATVTRINKVGYLVLWEKPRRRKRRAATKIQAKAKAAH